MKKIIILTALLFTSVANGKGNVHLTFHIAAGAEEKFRVGTTLENKGDSDVYGGGVVILPIDSSCMPLKPILKTFGAIKPGEKQNIETPVDHKLSAYRIVSLYAYDSFGYPLNVVDETREVIESRKDKEIEKCKQQNIRDK